MISEPLDRIDRYIKLRFPRIWILTLPHVLYQTCLLHILVLLFFMTILIIPNIGLPFIIFSSVGAITMVFYRVFAIGGKWLFESATRYNVEKEYGNTNKAIGLLEIVAYFTCIIVIASPLPVVISMASSRVQYEVGEVELVRAREILNQSNINRDYLYYEIIKEYSGITDFNNSWNAAELLANLSITTAEIAYDRNLIPYLLSLQVLVGGTIAWFLFFSKHFSGISTETTLFAGIYGTMCYFALVIWLSRNATAGFYFSLLTGLFVLFHVNRSGRTTHRSIYALLMIMIMPLTFATTVFFLIGDYPLE